jgi:putative membrane protein
MSEGNTTKLDDPRVYLAVERTYLAWIRTGLALMGFGFVVARFGIFLREINAARQTREMAMHGLSARFGTALVVLGVVLTFSAVVRYVRLLRKLERGDALTRPSRLAVTLGLTLAIVGAVVSLYLLLTALRA